MRLFSLRRLLGLTAIAMLVLTDALAQSFDRDNGNCVGSGGVVTVACWNPQAGADTPPAYHRHPEVFPNLEGWDYRINLPYVRFQVSDLGVGGPTAMVGVVEDPSAIRYTTGSQISSMDSGHRDNSIWLFRLKQNTGFVQYKVLPSRRFGAQPENIASLTNGWAPVGSLTGPRWTPRPISAHVIGKGFGTARIYLFIRNDDGSLHWTSRLISGRDTSTWTNAWVPLGITTSSAPEIAVGFDNRIVLAWRDSATLRVRLRVLDPATNTWGPEIVTQIAAETTPQLLWDGTAMNIFSQLQGRLRHSLATQTDFSDLSAPVLVAGDVLVQANEYHVTEFNNRLHLVFTQGSAGASRFVMYVTTITPKGQPPRWSIPSSTRLLTRRPPRIGSLYENLIVVATDAQGTVRYSRKDPNVAGNDITGRGDADRWTQAGEAVDDQQVQPLDQLQLLSFNSDLYLTANGTSGWMANLGRAVMKNLMTKKWGVNLQWGEIGGAGSLLLDPGRFAVGSETPAVGYFDSNRRLDFVIFRQSAEPDVGPAPVYVVRGSQNSNAPRELWHRFFALRGEIPAVGDFNGDGLSDIITFTQQAQQNADGTPIGPAVVWVALSNGTGFRTSQIWHRSFSPKTERPLVGNFDGLLGDDIASFATFNEPQTNRIAVRVALSSRNGFGPSEVWQLDLVRPSQLPLAGDFDGDGDDDIAVFSQQPETDSNGQLIGPAPVWVALSTRTRFGTRSLWHRDFAPRGERPAVADVNMDGKDDIVTFVSERSGATAGAKAVLVAFSNGTSFSRPVIWVSDLVSSQQRPFIGNITGQNLGQITANPNDLPRSATGIAALQPDGSVKFINSLYQSPYPPGAPWESYKWFTEKGIGLAAFPDWIYAHPTHCLSPNFIFSLLGSAGSGGERVMHTSVRPGGRAGHILEEFGHAVAANCLRESRDPFNLWQSIYARTVRQGGLDSTNRPGCNEDPTFYSCRPDYPEEHYFLQLLSHYRLNGDEFRRMITTSSNSTIYARRMGEYQWFKQNWFHGVEFKRGTVQYGGLIRDGVQCLPGECAIGPSPPPPPPPPPPTREQCLADCNADRDACMAEGERSQTCVRRWQLCRAACPR